MMDNESPSVPTTSCVVAYCRQQTAGLVCDQHASFGALLIAECGSGVPGDMTEVERKKPTSLIGLLADEEDYLFGQVNY